VLASVAHKLAADILDRFDQIGPLHETVSSPMRRMPGIWPLVTSR
jgi:hypothetical protein